MKTYYKSIFIPILCYGSNVWFQARGRIFSLIQRAYENFWSLSPDPIPNEILTPREYIRYFDICCMKRIFDGKTCLNFGDYYKEVETDTRAAGQKNLKNVRSNTQTRLDSFFVRTVEEWNAVPLDEKKYNLSLFKIFARSHIKHTSRCWRPSREGSIGSVTFNNSISPRRPTRVSVNPNERSRPPPRRPTGNTGMRRLSL